jgi:hypothetical protein
MLDDVPRRNLNERTGRHVCVRCLREVETEEYLRNDHLCDTCGAEGDYPLASTPGPKRKKNERR